MLSIFERPSPNHNPRREGPVDILLLHYTGMASAEAALDRLTGPSSGVRSHYLIDEDGAIWRLVDEVNRAWHAGAGFWAGCRDINSRSIGIELVNPGHELGYRNFPASQMQSLILLAQGILARHPIPPHRVLAHADVAPTRKQDPGELFDWALLAADGIGLWPDPAGEAPTGDPWHGLARIGYDPDAGDAAVIAFQRHFLPASLGRGLDPGTSRRIAQVAGQCPQFLQAVAQGGEAG